MKLKRRGYILFVYWSGKKPYIETGREFCDTFKELKREWNCHWDDKWDVPGRHKYHYFYFDVVKNKYFPLEKWKDDVNPLNRFESTDTKALSKKNVLSEYTKGDNH